MINPGIPKILITGATGKWAAKLSIFFWMRRG
jgi:hypothetical protein